jgi:uncharacterized protein YjbI with pentapeptide repeats
MEPIQEAVRQLSRFGRAARKRAMPIWKSARLQSEPVLQWLRLRPRVVFWAGGIGIALVLILGLVIGGGASWYAANAPAIAPLLTLTAGVSVAAVALIRHFAQTDADRQRRITESFSKAVEQLGSDKLEVRLGGIYSLERISKESPDDYWTVMENLTALIRERSRRNEAERTSQDLEQRVSRRAYFLWLDAGRPDGRAEDFWTAATKEEEIGESAVDITTVFTVLNRRSDRSREQERANGWEIGLSDTILKGYNLNNANLEGANLSRAHLEGADLRGAHLQRANLLDAHLEEADLAGAHLEGAELWGAHLQRANLLGAHLEEASLLGAHLEGSNLGDRLIIGRDVHFANPLIRGSVRIEGMGTHLEGADLNRAYLEGANLSGAHLAGADLSHATGLSASQLCEAYGDAATKLPEGMVRPAHWPSSAPQSPH